MSKNKIIAVIIAIPSLLSGPLHGVFFSKTSRNKQSKVPSSLNIHHQSHLRRRQTEQLVDLSSYSSDSSTTNGRMELPVLERPGSCGQAVHGNIDPDDKRNNLADLPLNELMIQLQKPPFVAVPNPTGPTVVDIGLFVYGIAHIDPAENTFLMEGFIDLVWCDPRLKFEVNSSDPSALTEHIFLEKDAERELEHIWWPTVFIVNEVLPRRIENEEIIIYADGTVEYREKFGVELSTNYDMRRFPFDTQILIAEIESFAWTSKDMVFHLEDDLVGFSDEFEVPEYNIIKVEEHLEEKMEPRDRHAYSELVAEIYVTRDPIYYVTKVIVPLSLIVCISWAVFWMDGEDLADRMAISFTGVLTSVAYQFIVAESLPRHIYNTFLDNFVLISFGMMALTIVENIFVSMLLKQEKKDTHERLVQMESKIRFMESTRSITHEFVEEGSEENENIPLNEKKSDGKGAEAHERNMYFIKLCNCINPPGTGEEKAKHLDRVCRYVFPLMYAVSVGILAGIQVP